MYKACAFWAKKNRHWSGTESFEYTLRPLEEAGGALLVLPNPLNSIITRVLVPILIYLLLSVEQLFLQLFSD